MVKANGGGEKKKEGWFDEWKAREGVKKVAEVGMLPGDGMYGVSGSRFIFPKDFQLW